MQKHVATLVESGLGHKSCLECTRAFLNYILRALFQGYITCQVSSFMSPSTNHLGTWTKSLFLPCKISFSVDARFYLFYLEKVCLLNDLWFFLHKLWVMPMPRYDDKEEDGGSGLDSGYPKKDAGIHEHHLTHIYAKKLILYLSSFENIITPHKPMWSEDNRKDCRRIRNWGYKNQITYSCLLQTL